MAVSHLKVSVSLFSVSFLLSSSSSLFSFPSYFLFSFILFSSLLSECCEPGLGLSMLA